MNASKKLGFGQAFSNNFFRARNLTAVLPTGTSTTAGARPAGIMSSVEELNKVKQEVKELKREMKELKGQLGHFGQQLASVKPEIVHAKNYDSARFNAWVDEILSEPEVVIVIGGTWCKWCKKQADELMKLPSGTRSYVVYVDDDTKVVLALKTRGHVIRNLPAIFKTTADKKFKLVSVGFTCIEELLKKLN